MGSLGRHDAIPSDCEADARSHHRDGRELAIGSGIWIWFGSVIFASYAARSASLPMTTWRSLRTPAARMLDGTESVLFEFPNRRDFLSPDGVDNEDDTKDVLLIGVYDADPPDQDERIPTI